MSAVSKKLMPASSAASTTAPVAASSMRPPKLLQPMPTTDTSRLPIARVSIRRTYCQAMASFDPGRVGIWTGVLDAVPSKEAQRIAGLIEELGFSTLWIPETVGRDPFITATLLLSATSTLEVATGIANIYARDPMTMANTQRSLEEAFPGRFLLGLGVSHHHLVDRVRHHDYSRPYSKMVQYLDEMDAALFMAVGPSERPTTVLAALGPKMLRLAAERAGGAHPYFVPVEHTAQAREILGPDRLLAPEQMVVLEPDRTKALAIA